MTIISQWLQHTYMKIYVFSANGFLSFMFFFIIKNCSIAQKHICKLGALGSLVTHAGVTVFGFQMESGTALSRVCSSLAEENMTDQSILMLISHHMLRITSPFIRTTQKVFHDYF